MSEFFVRYLYQKQSVFYLRSLRVKYTIIVSSNLLRLTFIWKKCLEIHIMPIYEKIFFSTQHRKTWDKSYICVKKIMFCHEVQTKKEICLFFHIIEKKILPKSSFLSKISAKKILGSYISTAWIFYQEIVNLT